jgi:hypothetical protein
MFDVRSFRAVDYDTDNFLVVAKVKERLAVLNEQHTSSYGEVQSQEIE